MIIFSKKGIMPYSSVAIVAPQNCQGICQALDSYKISAYIFRHVHQELFLWYQYLELHKNLEMIKPYKIPLVLIQV